MRRALPVPCSEGVFIFCVLAGGENVYPREVEEFLLQSDLVLDAAVYGVADDVLGEQARQLSPASCAVSYESLPPNHLRRWLPVSS